MIPLHRPVYEKNEQEYLASAMEHKTGQTSFCKLNEEWLAAYMGRNAMMTNSCTSALELSAELLYAKPGMEVIMPSFTFSSTANAFVKAGLVPVFVDIRKDTLNIDENKVEEAITDKTVAIVPMHYAGIACEMDKITEIAKGYNLTVIEDAAQALGARYKGKKLGSIGDFGCVSFHETKNFSMGEGGALLVRDSKNIERAEIIREKGTNRTKFFRGQIDKYTWVDAGSSYLPSELNAAHLFAQMEKVQEIQNNRMSCWNLYYEMLKELAEEGIIEVPFVPLHCKHNAHMFYIKTKNLEERTRLIEYLKEKGIGAVFHYVPLHSSPAGKRFGSFFGEDKYTTKESERLLRLPLYYGLKDEEVDYVIKNFVEIINTL